jgi:DnaJ-class molecular chaperone
MKRDYKIHNVEICRRCNGDGVVLNENREEEICSLCNGNGMVTVEKDLSIRIFPKTPKPHAGSR